jgi:hypothetical protein
VVNQRRKLFERVTLFGQVSTAIVDALDTGDHVRKHPLRNVGPDDHVYRRLASDDGPTLRAPSARVRNKTAEFEINNPVTKFGDTWAAAPGIESWRILKAIENSAPTDAMIGMGD